MPALRSMHYASAVGRPHAGSHAAMRYGARHAASATGGSSVAPLTIDEYLRLIDAIDFNDKHGEVCPANWTPGADTMKDNPTDSQSYFQKHG